MARYKFGDLEDYSNSIDDFESQDFEEESQDFEEAGNIDFLDDAEFLDDLDYQNESEFSEESEFFEDSDFMESRKSKDTKEIKKRSGGSNRSDYVNEHELSILMAMFKNWDGHAPKTLIFEEPHKLNRSKYDLAKAAYDACIKEGLDKRNPKVQEAFLDALNLCLPVIPNDKEIALLYRMMRLICARCIPIYGRNYNLELDDIAGTLFERWIKYRHNFDPLKRSEISGLRVNAFAYMTQMTKNTIYEFVNKANARQSLEEKLRGEMALFESSSPITPIKGPEWSSDDQKDFVSDISVGDDYVEADIIRLLIQKAPAHTKLNDLVLDVEASGFTRGEIVSCIGEYELLEALEHVLTTNRWAF